ncbi:MAG TPA: 6-carboxytetrahydropterin synthase [Bryobacteraceae bacterium]|nr:6-carboxytetrahydropterin synthase [Bryobacteraceae bacterium]
MIRLTRRYRFSASHRLHSAELSEEANAHLYGKCNNPFGHGHDYQLEVTVGGPVDHNTGQVVNPATLDALVTQYVLQDVSNRNLNEEVAEFVSRVPTSENLMAVIEERLRGGWKSVFPGEWPFLDRIRLHETKKNTFEWHA